MSSSPLSRLSLDEQLAYLETIDGLKSARVAQALEDAREFGQSGLDKVRSSVIVGLQKCLEMKVTTIGLLREGAADPALIEMHEEYSGYYQATLDALQQGGVAVMRQRVAGEGVRIPSSAKDNEDDFIYNVE